MALELMIWIILFVMLTLGAPIFVSLGVAALGVLVQSEIPLSIIPIDLLKVSDMFPLLAVVGFVFAGALMERGGMAAQIVDIASMFVGRIRGGLGIVTILGCMFFAAMIGSGPGTVAAMGSLMIPSMIRKGYSPEYAAGVSATGGTLGILIPPSNPMIVYGVIANVSISTLFMAGFVPGFLVGVVLMLTAYYYARRAGFKGSMESYTLSDFGRAFVRNVWSLMTPVVILGSIYAGICTPVEASVVAVFYSLFVGAVINRKLNLKELWEAIKLTNASTSTIIIVVGVSTLFGRFLTMYQIPQQLATSMLGITSDPYLILLMIAILLFFLGMFMETLATIVILTPVFMPVITQVGIDPVFFGIFWVMTNEVALLSPPLGVNLFIAMNISGLSLERVAKGAF
ncbi:MAG: TRAP transporter large permease, partial [Desulfocucumaceae bacterium]